MHLKTHTIVAMTLVAMLALVSMTTLCSDNAEASSTTYINIAPGLQYEYTPQFSVPAVLTIESQTGNWFAIVDGKLVGTIGSTLGQYTVVLKATSSNPTQVAYQTIVFNVLSTLSITTETLAPAIKGQAYSQQIGATLSANVTYSATGLPAGLSISSSGLISGTPTTIGSQSVTVTVSATSPTQSTSKTYTLLIKDAIAINGAVDTLYGAVGMTHTLQLSHNLAAGNWSLSGAPSYMSISSSGLITISPSSPAQVTGSPITVTVTVSDGNPAQSASVNINVVIVPQLSFTTVPTADMIVYVVG